MGRKKTSKKKGTSRRHGRGRVGGAVGHNVQNELIEVAGLIGGSIAAAVMQRQLTTMSPKVVAGLQIAGGVFLKNHSTHPFMKGVGYGVLSAGALGLTHDIGLIKGVDDFVSGLSDGDMGAYIEEGQSGIDNASYSVNGVANDEMVSGSQYDDYMTI